MKNYIILLSICILLSILLTGCSARPDESTETSPPLNTVRLVSDSNDTVVTMVMREYNNPISELEIQKLRNDVQSRWRGDTIKPVTPTVSATPKITDVNRLVVYGYALNPDGIPSEIFGAVGNAQSVSPSYRQGEDWLISQIKNNEYKMVSQ